MAFKYELEIKDPDKELPQSCGDNKKDHKRRFLVWTRGAIYLTWFWFGEDADNRFWLAVNIASDVILMDTIMYWAEIPVDYDEL